MGVNCSCWQETCPLQDPVDGRSPVDPLDARLEKLILELFRLHDLNADGVLDQRELVKLNEKITKLHHGKTIDKAANKDKYEKLFKEQLDMQGRPVAYDVFRLYMLRLLPDMDHDRAAQEMIAEQFVAEAHSGRAAFFSPTLASLSDAEFLSKLSLPDFLGSLEAPLSRQSFKDLTPAYPVIDSQAFSGH